MNNVLTAPNAAIQIMNAVKARKEITFLYYQTSIWTIQVEVNCYMEIIFWATVIYSDGTSKKAAVTPYGLDGDTLLYSSEFNVPKLIQKRILNLYKILIKIGLMQ